MEYRIEQSDITKETGQESPRVGVHPSDFLVHLLKELDAGYEAGHTEYRLSVLEPGHAIVHRHGMDSKTFDIFWER